MSDLIRREDVLAVFVENDLIPTEIVRACIEDLPAVQPDAELAIKVRDIIRRKVTFNDLPHTADLPDGTTHTGPVVDYLHDLLHLFLRVLDALIDKPGHVNETPKREHVPDDVLTRAAKGIAHD